MSQYNEKDVKNIALDNFIHIVASANKGIGQNLAHNKQHIRTLALQNMQVIGVHAYADKVVKRNSPALEALYDAIRDATS